MNRFDPPKKPESIRSEIDQTRSQMNQTIDALAARLKGRHLLDEILGLFRSSNGNGDSTRALGTKISESTSAAVHSSVQAVKTHPLPFLLVGAGLAWFLYERHEKSHPTARRSYYSTAEGEPDATAYPSTVMGDEFAMGEPPPFFDEDLSNDPSRLSPGETQWQPHSSDSSDTREKMREKTAELRDKAGAMEQQLQQKAGAMKEQARAGLERMRTKAGTMGARMQQRTQELSHRTREQVVRTTREHPLEAGLGCLALGLIAGLLIPTPAVVEEKVGPAGRRLRERAREAGSDLVQRGRNVVEAATTAAREEAQEQGLSPEGIKSRIREVTSTDQELGANAGPPIADQPDSPRV